MKSLSGLIKIPVQVLTDVTNRARQLLLSYAYHATRLDQNVQKHHDTILKLLAYYKIKPIEKHLLESVIKVDVDDKDLPDDYRKYAKSGQNCVIIKIDHQETRYLGCFKKPNIIVACVKAMYGILADPTMTPDRLFDLIADFDNTIEHELTHWVQHNYLHPDNSEKHYNLETDKSNVPYYTSQVEFDPTIKSDLSTFASKLHQAFPDGKFDMNELIKYYTLSGKKSAYELGLARPTSYGLSRAAISPSEFFRVLKHHKPEMYKKALVLFSARAPGAYENFKKFTQTVEDTEAVRQDYVWCKLRSNEFTHFVNLINTFIDYPDTRQHDFHALEKYLPKINDKFKDIRLDDKMFMRCNRTAIENVTVNKQAYIFPVIFVDHEIIGNGMMFDVSGLPMILDIDMVTHDPSYIEVCEDYDIRKSESKSSFAVIDGKNFKFGRRSLLGVYINGKLQE